METFFVDTETIGLHGPTVLIQYSEVNETEVHLHSVFLEPIYETLALIDRLCEGNIIAFNLAFDWFHLNHTFNTLKLFPDWTQRPLDHIDLYVELEEKARDGMCLKPESCLDLMLYAFKGPLQCTMSRKPIIIKKIPNGLATVLQKHLNETLTFEDIFFARSKNNTRWKIEDIINDAGEIVHHDFKNIVLRFNPSRGLKVLAEYALGRTREKYHDLDLPQPLELGYAPYAKAIMGLKEWPIKKDASSFLGKYKGTWPTVVKTHVSMWAYNDRAREYATMDVVDLRDLYNHFGCPDLGDDDSVLAAMVGATRLKGFALDTNRLSLLTLLQEEQMPQIPLDGKAARTYLYGAMDEIEQISCDGTTSKKMLQIIGEWVVPVSEGELNVTKYVLHPAAVRASEIMKARELRDQNRLYKKLLLAERFHASFRVIGAKSSRMSGDNDLNAQGINKAKWVRDCFKLAGEGEVLLGGDFKSFEVTIYLAIIGPGKLLDTITLQNKKIHGIFGTYLFPGKTYEEILRTDGAGGLDDLYTRSKSGVFLQMYGGTDFTIAEKLYVTAEVAQQANERFMNDFPEVGRNTLNIMQKYTAIKQEGGIGSRVEWSTPCNTAESLLGFKRFFDLEIKTMRQLFELAQKPPAEWTKIKIGRVIRRDRLQTACGALQSALYASAFTIQGHLQRVGTNHPIQSTGAEITKKIQRRLWDLQPSGIKSWKIRLMNVHDELIAVCSPDTKEQTYGIVKEEVNKLREIVPLLELDWKEGSTWAEIH